MSDELVADTTVTPVPAQVLPFIAALRRTLGALD